MLQTEQTNRAFYRVREIVEITGATKPWIQARITSGELDGRKVGGVVFVTAESVHRLFTPGPERPQA